MARFAIIEDGNVVNIVEAEADFAASQGWIDAQDATIGWLYDGQTFSPPPPPQKSPEEVQAEIIAATQKRLDDFAQTRSYDGVLSLCTYAASTNAKFAAEGKYGVEARDATWAKLYQMLAEVEAGARPMPAGFADVEPELPVLKWPDEV